MKCFKLTLAIALGAFLFTAMTAQATAYTSRQAGAWNLAATWNDGTSGYPDGTDDTATIATGHTVTVSSADGTAICGTLTINNSASAILSMLDGGLLQVETSVTVTSPGVFRFNAATTRPDLRATAPSVDLSGAFTFPGLAGGRLSYETSGDYFEVPSGSATFSGTYSLELDAPLKANGGDVTFSMAFDESSTGPFEILHANSTMTFGHSSAVCFDPGADVTMTAGVLDINETVRSRGDLDMSGGRIEVALNKLFEIGLASCPEE